MNWTLPTKRIYDGADLRYFERSIAFHRLQSVINKIVLLVQNQKVPDGVLNMEIVTRSNRTPTVSMPSLIRNKDQEITWSHNTQTLVDLFNELDKLITDTPPLQGPTRFGNLACRTWHDKVKPEIIPLLEKLEFPASLDINGFLTECSYYLENSFGSKVRLDYGTGHELSFIAFIGSLIEFNVLQDVTGVELLVIFSKYYDLVRRLILFYNLEPAGSHGVWGLDDHFHFIYILGASQFCNDKLAPVVQRALSSQVINSDKATNLYINAIAFIFKLKTGPFNEHSPIIYDIHSKVYSWIKKKRKKLQSRAQRQQRRQHRNQCRCQ
ncbi:Serine/threonine-protein phosphatase activator, putative [Candida maltosa Xu316]|uniref:Serine/threonine-protein phosphatase 2A activator n=1 Tax=Candida maltosa (strain Xu316) TaxID=1245528 RepID=M3JX97_CANMX|nr:Serine/threonine-protein phosphatase activator, putative [Candida maltosa Xu316]